MVDLIVLAIIVFFTLIGWRKGFVFYLAELATTLLSLAIAWFYYQQNQELLFSFFVFVAAFFILSIIKWILFSPMTRRVARETALSYTNHFLGGLCGAIWGSLIVILLVLTVDLLPLEILFDQHIKAKLYASRCYPIIQRLVPIQQLVFVENISYLSSVNVDEQAQLKLSEQTAYQELMQNENFKQVLEDRELLSQLQAQDLPNLLTNPKIRALLNDGEFIKQLMKLDFKQAAQ